jgi:hypothetical protein
MNSTKSQEISLTLVGDRHILPVHCPFAEEMVW